MAIKFKRDKDGNLIAVDENNNQIGSVSTMGDLVGEAENKDNKTQPPEK